MPAFELSWDDDAAETRVRAPESHVRLKQVPDSLPKLAPVLELPPALRVRRRRPPPLPRRLRITQALPLVRRQPWAAATRALPLVHKLELHLIVRRMRARRAWVLAWAAALLAASLGVLGFWLVRHDVVARGGVAALAQHHREAARTGFASLGIHGPEGARVTIDGRAHGKLPLSIDALSPGRHVIVIDGRPARGLLIREIELAGGEELRLGELDL